MNASVANAPKVTPLHPAASQDDMVDFQRDPQLYRHWRLKVEGVVATLRLDINEDAGIRQGYKLKLNSYDLGVDIELADVLERLRFEHPGVQVVVVTSGKDRIFCSGANIYMLGTSTHAWKVNFCKFTNETRNGMEHASRHSGLKFLAAVNGACAGGGYELALACDEIVLVDDRSSAVSLPEVPLLGVLPGTGGLTRLIDKRHVRRDRADVFCTTQEGQRAERAKKWNLIDDFAKPAVFAELIQKRAAGLAATSTRVAGTTGISWDRLEVKTSPTALIYPHLEVAIDAAARVATLTLTAPAQIESEPAKLVAQGVHWAPLALARELNDAILQLRTNHLEVGTWVLKTRGDLASVQRMDQLFTELGTHWLVKETVNLWDRVLAKLEVSSRSLLALVDPGSCFAGTFLEIALAADRIYMLQSDEATEHTPRIVVTEANRGRYLMVNGQTRLETRFMGDPKGLAGALLCIDQPLDAKAADEAGLVTFTPDEIDWDDEIRLMLEERASLSPDALTGMEASLRFAGAETMDTRIFGRLSAWQNWVFVRPNAVGENGALKIFGTGKRPQFDWRRV